MVVARLGFRWRLSVMYVCLSIYPHDVSKTDAARITKLHTQMFHEESWKSIYFGGRQVKGQGHKYKTVGYCALVSAGFF